MSMVICPSTVEHTPERGIMIKKSTPIHSLVRSHKMRGGRNMIRSARSGIGALSALALPGPGKWIGLGLFGLSTLADLTDVDPEKDERFRTLDLSPFTTCVRRFAHASPRFETVNGYTHVIDLWGTPLLFYRWGPIYCLVDSDGSFTQVEHAFHGLGRVIWEGCEGVCELVVSNSQEAEFRPYRGAEPLESEQGKALSGRIQRFLSAGHRRSILLHGDPGAGKSCMARYICEELGMNTLFIDAAQALRLDLKSLGMAFRLLQPQVIIMDDLDRVTDESAIPLLLSLIDRISNVSRLFIATANDVDVMSRAVVRTGRFDELELVERADDFMFELDWLPKELSGEVESWPASFISELEKRISTLGPDCAADEVERLRPRVARNLIGESGAST